MLRNGAARRDTELTQAVHPSGIVTFLFTDVEGSTTRWESHREAMQQALRRHDDVLRTAIEARGGYVFKTIGDAFCAAFDEPLDAVAAAIDVQRRLESENWDAVGGLRVRMAVHCGETDERGGDYFGPPVNRVARLLATGHGGQILASGAVSERVAERLPSGVSLHALGTLPLRDLKEPELVHQVVAEGLETVFKPLKALQTPPNNLPAQLTTIFGRNDDVAKLVGLVRASRIVTIVGTGGIGKTRVALDVAERLLNETSDGAWFVDFAPVQRADLVATRVLTAIGAAQRSDADPLDALVAHLAGRSLLLVLDNCEHLIDETARVVSAIAQRCPETAVIATTREAFGISGERVYPLSTLTGDASMQLFADRARSANPAFALDDRNREAVARICRKLDGIALGIELAAARVRSMPVEKLAQHLELRTLAQGGRDKSARQQTMRALIGWSYDLLTEAEKALFRRLGVFSGGMTIETATAVGTGEGVDEWDVLDLLGSLVEKSLVVAETSGEDPRYRLLEPIREFAFELLRESGELDDARRAHARAFARVADDAYAQWQGDTRSDWLEAQQRELDNYRAALRWSLEEGHDGETGASIAAGTGPVFLRLSLLREGVDWAQKALERAPNAQPVVRARLHYVLSMHFNNLTATAMALEHAQISASLYREAGNDRGLVEALSQLAQQRAKAGDARQGLALGEEAIALAQRLGDRALLATVLGRCANIVDADAPEASRRRYRESVRIFRELGRHRDAARVLQWWADTETLLGELPSAAAIVDEALPSATGELEMWLSSVGMTVHWALDHRERAEHFTRKTLALAAQILHPILLPEAVGYAAFLASERDPHEAARFLGYADTKFDEAGYANQPVEAAVFERLRLTLRQRLADTEREAAEREGSRWSDEHAAARAGRF